MPAFRGGACRMSGGGHPQAFRADRADFESTVGDGESRAAITSQRLRRLTMVLRATSPLLARRNPEPHEAALSFMRSETTLREV